MRDVMKITFRLFLITAVAGLALGLTYGITKEPIEAQAEAAAVEARKTVLPDALSFTELDSNRVDGIDSVFRGDAEDGSLAGYTAQVTVKGYGGNIEVTVGMNTEGVITGVNVGGSDFSETAGLGAHAKDPWFSEQFVGLFPNVELTKDNPSSDNAVDAITAATITSRAVTGGVNQASEYMLSLLEGGADE